MATIIGNQTFNKGFIFELPKIEDERGNLSFIETETHIPFPITRAYWIYDVPGGQQRGSHAFKTQHEVIIALSGSFDVILNDGKEEKTYSLNRSYKALYVPNMTWRSLENFSTNSVCLVLNSGSYSEDEYIRDFASFQQQTADYKRQLPSFHFASSSSSITKKNTVFDCALLEFPIVKHRAGSITAIEIEKNIPFHVERTFHIYDIPSGAERGMHAHKSCHELLIATTGSFEVDLDDGTNKRTVRLNSPKRALHIPPGIWASQREYSSGATCLALASTKYNLEGYINSYEEFKSYREL